MLYIRKIPGVHIQKNRIGKQATRPKTTGDFRTVGTGGNLYPSETNVKNRVSDYAWWQQPRVMDVKKRRKRRREILKMEKEGKRASGN